MSCLADFKVLPILDDKTDEIICEHMAERDLPLSQRVLRRFSKPIKKTIRKYIFRGRM